MMRGSFESGSRFRNTASRDSVTEFPSVGKFLHHTFSLPIPVKNKNKTIRKCCEAHTHTKVDEKFHLALLLYPDFFFDFPTIFSLRL